MAFFSTNGGVCAGTIYNSVSHGQNGIGIYISSTSASFTGYNTMHENGWSNLWNFTNGGNCVVANPLYNDPNNDDLTLQSTSPAIDAGLATYTTVTQDLNGNTRIIGAHPDMGAYEHDPCPIKLFVDIDASGANTGLDWNNAFNSLQDAIDLARSCMVDTIWVAEGTYRPSKTKAGSAANPNSRDNVFYIDFDVVIQGGFQGFETQESQRDWVAYETILDGNIGAQGTNADNCYTIVEYANCTNVSQMDGFTVRGGNSDGWNGSTGHGGGFVIYSSPIIRNCLITSNYGYNGGAMAINNLFGTASPAVLHCDIINNSGGVSAGIIVNAYRGDLTPTIANCDFSGNSAANGGAWAFYAYNASANCQPDVYNCKVWNNSAQLGAALILRDAEATITNCSFGNNVGSLGKFYNGYNGTRTSTIENCILWNPGGGAEIQNVAGVPFIVNNSIVRGGYGTGTNITTTDPMYINAATGDLRLNSASPAINGGINALMQYTDTYDVDYDGNVTEVVDIDLDGTLRVQNTTIDLGAYEFGGTLDEEEIEEVIASKVYPNPFSSGTNITIERATDDAVQLTVFNTMGQMIFSSEVSGSMSTIDTSGWLPGMYIVRIGEETLKVVKSN